MIKIIVCTTFRDFKGTENDKIQYLFLDNLKKQTYQNYLVVTTTFGEKNVKKVVDEYFGEKSIVKNVDVPSGYRFSLTDVILSGIDVIEKLKEVCIVIWCTCDVMIELDFFQKLVDNYSTGFSGIIHPNLIFTDIDHLHNNKGKIGPLNKGIDLLFFDGEVLQKARHDIIDYRFYDWGVFEYFLVAISMLYASKRINLYCLTKIKKIVNDRKLTDESKQYFDRCLAMNRPVLSKYIKEKRLRVNERMTLYFCHKQFKMININSAYMVIRLKFIFSHNIIVRVYKRIMRHL